MDSQNLLSRIAEKTKEQSEANLEDIEQFLTFSIEGELFGIRLLLVHEILKPVFITRLPNVESYILGVTNLRGEIIPIIDLRKRFSGNNTELALQSRIIVVMLKEKRCGILVDEVKQVVKVNRFQISDAIDDLSLNYNKMVESVSRYDENLILNLGLDQIIEFVNSGK